MALRCNALIAATICAAGFSQARAQAPRVATLDIEWENGVVYIDDVADPAKVVTSPSPVTPIIKNFLPFIAIADIVSVNGKPAKGFWVDGGRVSRSFQALRPARISETSCEEGWSIFTSRFSRVTAAALARS